MKFFTNPIKIPIADQPGQNYHLDNVVDAFNILFLYEATRFFSYANNKNVEVIDFNDYKHINNLLSTLEKTLKAKENTIKKEEIEFERSNVGDFMISDGRSIGKYESERYKILAKDREVYNQEKKSLDNLKYFLGEENIVCKNAFLDSFSKYKILKNNELINNIAQQILDCDEFKICKFDPSFNNHYLMIKIPGSVNGVLKKNVVTYYNNNHRLSLQITGAINHLSDMYKVLGRSKQSNLSQMQQFNTQEKNKITTERQQIPTRDNQLQQELENVNSLLMTINSHQNNDDKSILNFIHDSMISGFDLKNITKDQLKKIKTNQKKLIQTELKQPLLDRNFYRIAKLKQQLDILYKYLEKDVLEKSQLSLSKDLKGSKVIRICSSSALSELLFKTYGDLIVKNLDNSNDITKANHFAINILKTIEDRFIEHDVKNISKHLKNPNIKYMFDQSKKFVIDLINLDLDNINDIHKSIENRKNQYSNKGNSAEYDLLATKLQEIKTLCSALKANHKLEKYQKICKENGISTMSFEIVNQVVEQSSTTLDLTTHANPINQQVHR